MHLSIAPLEGNALHATMDISWTTNSSVCFNKVFDGFCLWGFLSCPKTDSDMFLVVSDSLIYLVPNTQIQLLSMKTPKKYPEMGTFHESLVQYLFFSSPSADHRSSKDFFCKPWPCKRSSAGADCKVCRPLADRTGANQCQECNGGHCILGK